MAETPKKTSLQDVIADAQWTARDQLNAAWQLYVERVEERLREGWGEQLERVFAERFEELSSRAGEALRAARQETEESAAARHAAEVELAVQSSRAQARRELSESLNQNLRRLGQCEDGPSWTSALLDATRDFCEHAAVFSIAGDQLRCEGVRVPEGHAGRELLGLQEPLGAAPAFAAVADSKDVSIAARTAGELSEALASAFGPDGRAYLFPVVSRQTVVAVLYAQGDEPPVDANGLELACTLAASALEARVRSKAAAALVSLGGEPALVAAAVPKGPEAPALSREAEELHARAQRFARVQVAEMRLYKSGAVKAGRAEGRLYAALREDIDRGREEFYRQFISAAPTMVDYFHQELVRTLANDDEALLGAEYPGPLV
ncbi:MAG: hypothetical protein SFV54_01700 [Bryobacteraceae bacterium]|nr:hypothetical protein [Bryobacteraceae bacterium]